MKIAVVGTGTMGQLFGTLLIDAGHDVVMIDTSASLRDRIRRDGLTLRMGQSTTHVAARAEIAADVHDPVDLVVVFTKSMHSEAALASVAHLVAAHTVGLSVQNGLGNEGPLAAHFGLDRTVVGVTDYPADRGSAGEISSSVAGSVTLGGLTPAAAVHAGRLVEALRAAGFTAESAADISVPIWEKAIFNAVMNTVSASTGLTVGQMGTLAPAQMLSEGVLTECFAVAQACGVRFHEARVQQKVARAFREHGEHKTSMLQDLEAGRATEIEGTGGALARAGAERGVATPVLATLSNVVRLRTLAAQGERE